MDFPHGRTVERLRAGTVRNEYSQKDVAGDWSHPDVVEIPGAYVAQSSTSSSNDATRSQALESKSLFCDGTFDIRKGDRIRVGGEGGPVYKVEGIPDGDVNPFTGWSPPREIPLARSVG